MSYAGRLKTVTLSGVTGVTTVDSPVSGSIIQDPELTTKRYSNKKKDRYFQTKEVEGVRFTCADVDVFKALKKGTYVDQVKLEFEGAYHGDGSETGTAGAIAVTATLDDGIVTEAVEFESQDDGPNEYTFTIMACVDKTGSEGKLTVE